MPSYKIEIKSKILYPNSSGKVKGRRIIDVVSGPTIHMMIPAAKWFDESYISDFSLKNIEAQKKWFAMDPNSYDWKPFSQYFAEKDGKVHVLFSFTLITRFWMAIHSLCVCK